MTHNVNSFQQLFLERLSRRFNSRSELVHEVAGTLHVGRDAVYRRLRGDTALTADELMLLAETYKVRMVIGGRSDYKSSTLRYPDGRIPVRDEFDHFMHLQLRLQEMKRLPGVSFDFASPELPMYYEMALPTLRSFKIFMFGITSWNLDKWKDKSFSPDLISDALHGIVEQIVVDHYFIPARELWSVGILDVTLRQINYLVQVGRFTRLEDAHRLFDELLVVIDHLEHMVRTGKRFPLGTSPRENSPDLRVYHNELSSTNSVVIVNADERSFLFNSVVSPNYVATTDPVLVSEVQDWFNNLVEHGNSLHHESGKYAAQYFSYLRQRVRQFRDRTAVGQTPL